MRSTKLKEVHINEKWFKVESNILAVQCVLGTFRVYSKFSVEAPIYIKHIGPIR